LVLYMNDLNCLYRAIVSEQFLDREPSEKLYADFKRTLKSLDRSFSAMENRIFNKPSPNQLNLNADE
jgi:hypothetical protein